jgi:hypothetical protein
MEGQRVTTMFMSQEKVLGKIPWTDQVGMIKDLEMGKKRLLESK